MSRSLNVLSSPSSIDWWGRRLKFVRKSVNSISNEATPLRLIIREPLPSEAGKIHRGQLAGAGGGSASLRYYTECGLMELRGSVSSQSGLVEL